MNPKPQRRHWRASEPEKPSNPSMSTERFLQFGADVDGHGPIVGSDLRDGRARRQTRGMSAPPILWRPRPGSRSSAPRSPAYARWLEQTRGLDFPDYASLWEWSTTDLEGFWALDLGAVRRVASAPVRAGAGLAGDAGGGVVPGSAAQLSPSTLLAVGSRRDAVAIRHASELRSRLRELTWDELRGEVARLAGGLRALGVGPGDRVAAYSAEHPGGGGGVSRLCVDRGHLVELLAGFRRPERDRPVRPDRAEGRCSPSTATATGARTSTARRSWTSCWRRCRRSSTRSCSATSTPIRRRAPVRGAIALGASCARGARGRRSSFEQVPFAHPLWVLYSSGTTGLPKAIVHGHGGILLEIAEDDEPARSTSRRDDRLFWFTTTGWMMWNFVVGGLSTDASIVLYDGNPGTPDLGVLWDLAEAAGITCFGTSAAYHRRAARRRRCGRPRAAISPRCGRSARRARRSRRTGSPGCTTRSARTSGCSRRRAAPMSAPRSSAASRPCRSTRASCRRGRSAPGSRRGARTGGPLVGEVGRARADRADALDAALLLGRRGRQPLPGELLRDVSRGLAARGLDRDHRSRHGDHLGPLRRDDQPRRHQDGHERDLPGRPHARRGRGRARARSAPARHRRVHAALRRAPRGSRTSTTSSSRGSAAGSARTAHRGMSPTRVEQIAEVPRTLSGKALELPVKRILLGAPAETTVSRDALASPDGARPLRGAGRQAAVRATEVSVC